MPDAGHGGTGGASSSGMGNGGGGRGGGRDNDKVGTGNPGKGNIAGPGAMANGRNDGGNGGLVAGDDFDAANVLGNLSGTSYAGTQYAGDNPDNLGGYERGSIGELINPVVQWAKNNPAAFGGVLGTLVGAPIVGTAAGLMGKFGVFSGEPTGIPSSDPSQQPGRSGGGGPNDSPGGIASAGLANADADGGEGAEVARTLRPFPYTPVGTPNTAMPTYDQLYERYSNTEQAPGSEAYANPNLFSYGTEVFRYDPANDAFASLYSGNFVNNPNAINGGLGSL